ncbi:hypothetical protein FNH22_13950 [Fulvivirga sp. M361]|uniref:tetratricopeptide repeat-containing sensor histidine kinase n=1 Tax=Fulvivirga sp. M361 TaxID=2594266 RepID=UPI00117B7B12|nr:histidine kinase [Fulvivirga sp. M361]TRX58444.1 hypothetical protein FNH22_13950 [Fulvivirga sp. M361]
MKNSPISYLIILIVGITRVLYGQSHEGNFIPPHFYLAKTDSSAIPGLLKAIEKNVEKEKIAYFHLKAGTYYFEVADDLTRAIHHFNTGLKVTDSTNIARDNLLTICYLHYSRAKVFFKEKKYKNALKSLYRSLDAVEDINPGIIALIKYDLAQNYHHLGEYDHGLNYFKQVLKEPLCKDSLMFQISTNFQIGIIYAHRIFIYDSARVYLRRVITLSEGSYEKEYVPKAYKSLGSEHYELKNWDSLQYYFDKVREAYQQYNITLSPGEKFVNRLQETIVLSEVGIINDEEERYRQLLVDIRDLDLSPHNIGELYHSIYVNLILYYKRIGNYKKSTEALEERSTIVDSMRDELVKKRAIELEVEYETKKKEDAIDAWQLQAEKQQTINLLLIFSIGLLITLIVLGFLFFKQKALQAKFEKANLQQRLLRAQMNPHFLFNTLSTAVAMVHKKSDNAIAYLTRFSELLRMILNNSREEFISLDTEIEGLTNYLMIQSEFSAAFRYQIDVDPAIDQTEILIPQMLIQPFLENAIEHGIRKEQGTIILAIRKENQNLLHCSVEDNGVGWKNRVKKESITSGEHFSVSGDIVEERLAIFSKKLKADARMTICSPVNEAGNGTRVNLYIPFIEDF